MAQRRKPTATVGTRRSPRPRGTGSIQERTNSDGSRTFYAVVRRDGKPRWHKAGPTARSAQLLLNEKLAELARNEAVRLDVGVSFDEYANDWIVRFRRREKKPSTKDDYERIVRKVLIPSFGKKPLLSIDRDDVQALLNRRTSGDTPDAAEKPWKPVSVKTAMNEVAVLRKLLNDARHQDGKPTKAAWRGLDVPEHKGRPRVFLRPHQVYALLGATPSTHELMMRLLCYLGLRLGECLALQWSDFDQVHKTLLIERSWSHSRLIAPKTTAGRRTLPLSDPLSLALTEARPKPAQVTSQRALLFGFKRPVEGRPNPHGLMFPSKRGGYQDAAHWRQTVFHPAARAAGLPEDTVPHSLRHTAAVLMLKAGMPMGQVRANLGHNSIGITMDLYARMDPGEFGTAADVMGRI